MKGYALIGAGSFGAEYGRIITAMPDCRLICAYSPGQGASKVANETGCEVAHDISSMLADNRVDAVIIASPNHLHHQHVLLCAKAGKHVYCEKPFALNRRDAMEMIEACEKARIKLMIAHVMHFYAGISELKRRIDKGEFGTIVNMHVERTGWEQPQKSVSWKKMQALSGGHLFHHIHEIDLVQWIMGQPETVYAVGGNYSHQDTGFGDEDDILLLTVTFANGLATFQYGSGFRMANHFVRINGTKKGAYVDFENAEITIAGDGDKVSLELFSDDEGSKEIRTLFAHADGGIHYAKPGDRPPKYLADTLRQELAVFNEAISTGHISADNLDLFNGTSAVRSVTIAEAALISKNDGKPIHLVD